MDLTRQFKEYTTLIELQHIYKVPVNNNLALIHKEGNGNTFLFATKIIYK